MCRYIYAFRLDEQGGDVVIRFPKFPEIFSAIPKREFSAMTPEDVADYASDAVITALQMKIITRDTIPDGDDKILRADGYVLLTVPQAMKLELFKLYKENCRSVVEFARRIDRKETAARRLLNLRHQSTPGEIESAFRLFGQALIHDWHRTTSFTKPAAVGAMALELS